MCSVFQVSQSGYYAYLKTHKANQSIERDILKNKVIAIHKASRGTYRTRRISAQLKKEGDDIGRYQTRTLMKESKI